MGAALPPLGSEAQPSGDTPLERYKQQGTLFSPWTRSADLGAHLDDYTQRYASFSLPLDGGGQGWGCRRVAVKKRPTYCDRNQSAYLAASLFCAGFAFGFAKAFTFGLANCFALATLMAASTFSGVAGKECTRAPTAL